MGEHFGTNRLSCARRPGKVEGERESGRTSLAKAPAIEDEVVLRDLRKRLVEGAACCRGQNHIVEGAARDDRLNRTTSLRSKQPGKRKGRHFSLSMQDLPSAVNRSGIHRS